MAAKTEKPPVEKSTELLANEHLTVPVNGVEVTLNIQDLDDVEVLYQVREASKGDLFAALDVIDVMVGEQQRKMLTETVRDPETGRASVEDFVRILEQLFEAVPKL